MLFLYSLPAELRKSRELLDNPLVLPPKGHSILRKRLNRKTKSPLSYKEDKGLLPLE